MNALQDMLTMDDAEYLTLSAGVDADGSVKLYGASLIDDQLDEVNAYTELPDKARHPQVWALFEQILTDLHKWLPEDDGDGFTISVVPAPEDGAGLPDLDHLVWPV